MAELSAGQAKRATVDLKKILTGVPTHAECGMGGALMKWKELARRAVRFMRRFLGISESATAASREAAERDLSAADEDFMEPEEDGYLQYWRDGLKCKVELFEGYTSFGRPGGTWRSKSLPESWRDEGGNYALFKRAGDSYTVAGAGDKAEIFVRGERLKYPETEKNIHSGDKIRVGNCELVFFRRSCPTVTVGGGKA